MRTGPPGSSPVETIDPDHPVYEVVFWSQRASAAVPDPIRMWTAEEWTVHQAEASEVLDWAREQAADRPYTVHVLASPEENFTEKLRLYGQSPVSHPLPDSEPFQLSQGES
jgi:hypothetical protein